MHDGSVRSTVATVGPTLRGLIVVALLLALIGLVPTAIGLGLWGVLRIRKELGTWKIPGLKLGFHGDTDAAKQPGTTSVRELDTGQLLTLEAEARSLGFSQRLSEDWVGAHVRHDGLHQAQVVLDVHEQDLPTRARHWRVRVLVTMQDGRRALSLLDVVPASLLQNSRPVSADENRRTEAEMGKAVSVAEWEHGAER